MDAQQALHLLTAMQYDHYWREALEESDMEGVHAWAHMRDRHLVAAVGHTKDELQRIQLGATCESVQ